MELKQNPFSFYDFLGYFTPGAIAIYGGMLIFTHAEPGVLTRQAALDTVGIGSAQLYVPFVLAAYLLGHFLSYLSSITVERFAIWVHGYPSRFLLGLPVRAFWAIPRAEIPVRFVVGLLLFPIPLLDSTVGKYFFLRRLFAAPLDDHLRGVIQRKVEHLMLHRAQVALSEYSLTDDHDFFRFVYHFTLENAPNHVAKMQNYVALYGFLRTITFVFALVAWSSLGHLVISLVALLAGESPALGPFVTPLILFSAATYVAYTAFMKFYRRFSLESLMALSVVYSSSSEKAR
jgi:hypothetical protein